MIEIFASFVMYLGVTIFVCIMSYSNTDFESFGEFKEKHPILLVVFWFIVSSIYGVISAFSTFVVIFFIRDVPLGFICSAVFWGTFFVAYMWVNIHGRGIRKFEEIGIEGLAVLPFAAMVGISVTFSFVFSIILIFTFLGASLSPTISSALSLTLFGQFIIILLYPLYEFLIFAKEGKQATEIYHRSVEKITDYIRTRIKPADFDANEAILDRYSLITGSIFYLVLFFVLIPLGAIFALMLFNKTTDLGSFIWFTFLLYPTIILGYYASLGVFDNLRPLVYLRKYTSLKNWFGLIVFLFACYSFITFTTGISLSQLFTILIRIFFPDFAFPDWLALLLLFVPIMASIFLVSLGLYKDYWKVKPPTRLLDYLFTAYLFSTLATLVFITFLTSHPNILITGLTLQSSNFLLGLLTIIEEIAITLLIIGLLLLGRRKYSQIDHTERPVLLWIEYQIGESIPQLSQMEETSFGFVVEENHITGLGLYNKNLKTLPKDINRLSQLNVLSLGQSQLRELPNALEELSNLQALNLRENHLKSILPSLKLPQTLQKLNLADNKLDSLPESLKNQINLEWLNLNGNQLQILPEWLGELSNLQVLGLLGNRLQTLPETFFQLTNLQTLDLSYNEFTSLPESFGNLSNLMWLNLNSNQLTVLPEWFGRLIRLQSLGLGNNQLETLPTSFGNLKKLKEVYLFDNQLTKLPNEIGQLSSLQILQLANNNLEFLPETIENLDKLTSLNLHENPLISLRGTLNNLKRPPKKYTQVNEPDATILFLLECLVGKEIPQISEIDKDIFGFTLEKGRVTNLRLSKQGLMVLPESFSQLTQLVELNLENNQLERLPKSFGQLTQLVALNLSHNKLDSLPDSFSQLTNLQLLNLTNNQLEDLPESFGQLKKLVKLYLSKNEFSSYALPFSLFQLSTLQVLDLGNNNLISLPNRLENLTNLKHLYLQQNELRELPMSFGNLIRLEVLKLQNNKLQILPESFGQLKRLKELELQLNQLTSLPESFGQLTQLVTLDLSYNKLNSFPNSFYTLARLQSLDLGNNQFTSLPERFGELIQLTELKLMRNELRSLPESFERLVKLKLLDLSYNQLIYVPDTVKNLKEQGCTVLGVENLEKSKS